MTKPTFDQDFWGQLWSNTLRDHADRVASRPPNPHLMARPPASRRDAPSTPAVHMAQTRSGSPRTAGGSRRWISLQRHSLRSIDGRCRWNRCRGAHRLDRERYLELGGGAGTLRSRCLLERPRGRRRGRHGEADGERRRSGWNFDPGWTPPDRSQHRRGHSRGKSAVTALDPSVWELVVAEERARAVAGSGVATAEATKATYLTVRDGRNSREPVEKSARAARVLP